MFEAVIYNETPQNNATQKNGFFFFLLCICFDEKINSRKKF